ncbi:hypothetical protein [Chitinophaga dinghuensis]|nr:hypothetical protein [Chitinophaga dinghuensis]
MRTFTIFIFLLGCSLYSTAQKSPAENEYDKIVRILSARSNDNDTLGKSLFYTIMVKTGKTTEVVFSGNYYFADSTARKKELAKLNWALFGKGPNGCYIIPVYYLKRSYDDTVEFDAKGGIIEGHPASGTYWSDFQQVQTLPAVFITKYNGPKKAPVFVDKSGLKQL